MFRLMHYKWQQQQQTTTTRASECYPGNNRGEIVSECPGLSRHTTSPVIRRFKRSREVTRIVIGYAHPVGFSREKSRNHHLENREWLILLTLC